MGPQYDDITLDDGEKIWYTVIVGDDIHITEH